MRLPRDELSMWNMYQTWSVQNNVPVFASLIAIVWEVDSLAPGGFEENFR